MERRGLRGGAEGKLVHVGLADGQAARVEHTLDTGGGVDALVVLEHAGGAGGTCAREHHVVLDGERHAGERWQGLAGRAVRVDTGGGVESELRRDLEERLDGALARLDGVECGMGDLGRGEVTGGDARGNLGGGEGVEGSHY